MISLRLLFFAFEDRMQITKPIIETLQWLSTVFNGSGSAKELWEIDTSMTNAASKNLKVGIEVARMLRLDHVLLHLLCKSHTCEKFYSTNIERIAKISRR